jgi:hypothetical protein
MRSWSTYPLYTELFGLPGCAGSAGYVHVFWDMYPAHDLQSPCKGKEKFPSLLFEVVASYTKQTLSVSGVQYGTDKDKTISRSDSAILHMRKEGDILKQSTFKYSKEDISVAKEKGYFYIVDEGYNIWIELIGPSNMSQRVKLPMYVWSKQIESVCKDVECILGYLRNNSLS